MKRYTSREIIKMLMNHTEALNKHIVSFETVKRTRNTYSRHKLYYFIHRRFCYAGIKPILWNHNKNVF